MKRPKTTAPTNQLLSALRSLSAIVKADGSPLETHVIIAHSNITAFNGVIAMGEKINTDLYCAPNADKLNKALSKCGQTLSITQADTKLTIASGPFRAQIPFLSAENIQRSFPDEPCGSIDERLKKSFEIVANVPEREEVAITASALISGGSIFATDRTMILESYHANNLPVLAVPKNFIKIAKGIKKQFKAFGFSNNSFTIYMDDDSWIKTQLWQNAWPDVASLLNTQSNFLKIPDNFWEALSAVDDFSDDGWAYSREGRLYSHNDDAIGSSYECQGLPPNMTLRIEQLLRVKSWATKIDFFAKTPDGMNCVKVFGDMTRCIIAGIRN